MSNFAVFTPVRTLAGSLVLAGSLLVALTGCSPEGVLGFATEEAGTTSETGPMEVAATMVRAVDGDTLVAQPTDLEHGTAVGEPLRVRVLGIDTPEMDECGGEEAKVEVGRLISEGSPITLRYDEKADRVDRYDRALAYVEIGPSDLGELLTSSGFAGAWYPQSAPEPSKFAAYDKAAQQAEAQAIGLWSSCGTLGR